MIQQVQLQRMGVDTAYMLRWARQQQFADDFPGHPWHARALRENGVSFSPRCAVDSSRYVPFADENLTFIVSASMLMYHVQ